jgi:hypothetical protein
MSGFNFNNFLRGFIIMNAVDTAFYEENYPEDVDTLNTDLDYVKPAAKSTYLVYGKVSNKVKPKMRKHWGECI